MTRQVSISISTHNKLNEIQRRANNVYLIILNKSFAIARAYQSASSCASLSGGANSSKKDRAHGHVQIRIIHHNNRVVSTCAG